MKHVEIPDYMTGVVTNTRNAFSDMLTNPVLWSDNIIKETLNRSGSQAFNISDVQHLVKNYLTLLSETIKEGRNITT